MTCYKGNKTNYDVEEYGLCFFEFFLISSRAKDEPSSVNYKYNCYESEKSWYVSEYFSKNIHPIRKIFIRKGTGSYIHPAYILTVVIRFAINRRHKEYWDTYKKKSN